MFGSKYTGKVMFGHKSNAHAAVGHKNKHAYSRGVVTIPGVTGAGDTGSGVTMHGNTPNPIGNAQRDGQMRDMRSGQMPGTKRPMGNKLESKKKNKTY